MANIDELNQALGFSPPPFRIPYEEWKTDYGIGIIGLHWVMQIMHLPAYRSAGYRTVAAAEIDEGKVEQTQRKGHRIGPVLNNWRELVTREDVAVIDCTFGHHPSKQHRRKEVVAAAAEAGKHLMIHKPPASTLGLAEEMARIAEGNIHLAVNLDCRYNPACYTIKNLLTPDRLGKPLVIEVRNYWKGNVPDSPNDLGAYLGHTIHHADLIRWWVGSPCVSVVAKVTCDSTLAIYEFANGTVAYHMEGHAGVEGHETEIRVTAERGIIRAGHNWNWHFSSPGSYEFVEIFRNKEGPAVRLPLPGHIYEPVWSDVNPFIPRKGPYYDLAGPIAGMMGSMGSLMRGVELSQPPDNHIAGAIESMRMCLAAQLSAQSGKPVDPADVPSETTSAR